MGNCYPRRSKQLKEKTELPRSRPFFREKSLEYTRRDEICSYGGLWEKRQSVEEVFGSIRAPLKVTVFDKEPKGERQSITGYEEEDHYDQINESEIESIPEKQKNRRKLPPPPTRRLPWQQKSKSPDTDQYTNASIQTNPKVASFQDESNISEMVEIFQPLIVNNLLVHEVLPYLSFLESHSDLYEEVKKCSQKAAAASLLQELQRSTKPGKWLKFINVLNECGYTYIVKNIRGYTFVNHSYQKDYLKTITPKVSKMIDPSDLIPYLLAANLISDNDKENIQREKANFGDIEASVLLLDRITRKHEDWYILFVKVLQKAGRDDVAADLMIPQLIQNPKRKDRDTSWLPKMTKFSPREIEDQSDDDALYALPPAPPRTATIKDSSRSYSAEHQKQRSEDEYDSPVTRSAYCTESDLSEKVYDLNPEPVTDRSQCKPPIPPRKPFKEKYPIPLQIMDNSDYDLPMQEITQNFNAVTQKVNYFPDNDDNEYEVYDDNIIKRIETMINDGDNDQQRQQILQKCNIAPQRVNYSQDQNDDNEYEIYDDTLSKPIGTMANDADASDFQTLQHDIRKLELENKNICLRNDLLERKSTLNENINKGIRKQRELQNEIAMKEKEKQALQSGYDFQNGTSVPEDNMDEYYPTNKNSNGDREDIQEPSAILRNWTKCTFDYRPLLQCEHSRSSELPLMTPYSPPSTVQLFSPNFGIRSIISQRFELDSGIGADLLNIDSDCY